VAVGGDRGALEQEQPGPGIDHRPSEDAGVGGEPHDQVGEHEVDRALLRGGPRIGVEVVAHQGRDATLHAMAPYSIRVVGDPVLRQRASEVSDIDGRWPSSPRT
jgi:hypothetical protein